MKNLTLFLLLIVMSEVVHSQGLISGRIIDENKMGLPGVSIYIKKLSKTSVSDETGRFKMLGVPQGRYTLEISYVGFTTIEKELTVEKNGVTALDIPMTAVKQLQHIIVNGSTGATLKALNQQKSSNRIVNVYRLIRSAAFRIPILATH